jgi:hypothetical protein
LHKRPKFRKEKLSNDRTHCMISGFYCNVDEICVLLIQDIVYNDKIHVTFCMPCQVDW